MMHCRGHGPMLPLPTPEAEWQLLDVSPNQAVVLAVTYKWQSSVWLKSEL